MDWAIKGLLHLAPEPFTLIDLQAGCRCIGTEVKDGLCQSADVCAGRLFDLC